MRRDIGPNSAQPHYIIRKTKWQKHKANRQQRSCSGTKQCDWLCFTLHLFSLKYWCCLREGRVIGSSARQQRRPVVKSVYYHLFQTFISQHIFHFITLNIYCNTRLYIKNKKWFSFHTSVHKKTSKCRLQCLWNDVHSGHNLRNVQQ